MGFTSAPGATENCAKCGLDVKQGRSIHLWDGNDYCIDCVSTTSGILLAMAEQLSELSEEITVNPADAIRDEMRAWSIVAPAIVGALTYVGVTNGAGLWDCVLISMLGVIPAASLRILGALRNARKVWGRVAVGHGELTVTHPYMGKLTWDLNQCRWHVGKAREAKSFFPHLYLSRKVVIITCPVKLMGRWRMHESIPCGLTDETREVWEAFFTLAYPDRRKAVWFERVRASYAKTRSADKRVATTVVGRR